MNLLLTPLLVPLVTAGLAVLAHGRPQAQRALSLAGALVLLGSAGALLAEVSASGRLSLALGDWPLPYGIEFVADRLSAALAAVAALLGVACVLYAWREPPRPMLHPLLHGLLASVGGALLTADLFNLYVWFELMLIAVLGLLVMDGGRHHREATLRYLVLNLVGTLLFLTAVALIYGAAGQLNFGALAVAARDAGGLPAAPLVLLAAALLLKSAAFPLYFWLPASYHVLPTAALALVGGLVTKVGVYALLRLFGEVFPAPLPGFHEALGWLAVATMVSGVLGAAYHWDLRRILAFHIVSQIGYLLLAVAMASPAASAAALFFLLHNILAKAALFLAAGMICLSAGHWDLRRIGGLYPARPLLALLFLAAALSLVGIPPSSGFWGKFLLVQEAFAQGRWAWGGAALAVGLLTPSPMVKIWLEGFWKPHPAAPPAAGPPATAYAAMLLLVSALVLLGLLPEPFLRYAHAAAAGAGALP